MFILWFAKMIHHHPDIERNFVIYHYVVKNLNDVGCCQEQRLSYLTTTLTELSLGLPTTNKMQEIF